MPKSHPTLFAVWREVCRHLEIHESAVTIAGLLARQIPLGQFLLRRLDADQAALVTVGITGSPADPKGGESRRVFAPAERRRVLAWFRSGRPLRSGVRHHRDLELLLPSVTKDDTLVTPLFHQQHPAGVAVFVARGGRAFDRDDVRLVEAVGEPLAVALENDRRLHEMAALREAAEAERGALLRRLGRSRLSDTIVGEESGLRHVMERVDLVAKSDVPVLILGETGTGKELVARAIHNRSPRHDGPFLRVNCGAIPAELIDSQLFGHERGSFTGAEETRAGWFERADGGTLFLDEIGELPLDAQVRFLRVLQDGFVERVGGREHIHVDVRIVAATHRDLTDMVRERKFREDLWYRVAVFPILLPPLRERREDIADIARHFAERAALRFGLSPVLPSAEDEQLLMAYDWPGNIRELGAVIDRAAILGQGHTLEVAKALGFTNRPEDAPPRSAAARTAPRERAVDTASLPSLDEAMRQHIEAALQLTEGRIEGKRGAAAMLKINPHTLRARMRKLGIDWRPFRAAESSQASFEK